MKRKLSPVPFLAATEFNAVQAAIETVKTNTSWRAALTNAEKSKLFKLGTSSEEFVADAQDAGEAHPNVLRKKFNMSEMIQRIALREQIKIVLAGLVPLVESLQATDVIVGADLMQDSLSIYEDLQVGLEDEPGLEPVIKALGKRFEKSKKEKPTPVTPA